MFNKKNQTELPEEEILDSELENFPSPDAPDQEPEETQKLNAVRELLFGKHDKQYRTEFEGVKALVNKNKDESDVAQAELKSQIMSRLDQLEISLNQKIDDTTQTLTARLDQLADDKADKKKVASLLHDLARQLES